MAISTTVFPDSQRFASSGRAAGSATAAWSIYAVLFASTSVILGVIWDISWHRSIGRDTFWTPAHIAIYLGGIVAGLTSGCVALRTTFAGSEADRGERLERGRFPIVAQPADARAVAVDVLNAKGEIRGAY